MQTLWFSDLKTKEEQEKFKELVQGSTLILDKLKKIVYNRYKNGELSIDYDNPNWAYRVADRAGELRAFKFILDMLDI